MNSNKLQVFALTAEIISALAVVITLFILIFEVRANTETNRALAYGQSIDRYNENRDRISTTPGLAEIVKAYFDGNREELDELDLFKLDLYLQTQWSTTETAYVLFNTGMIDESAWKRFEGTICVHYRYAFNSDIWASLTSSLTTEFTDFVSAECANDR